RDPSYALAFVGLADATTLLVRQGVRPIETLTGAVAAARRALELDPSMGEAHASLGLVALQRVDLPAARDELSRAVELAPNYEKAHSWLGQTYETAARPAEARDEYDRALQLDPASVISSMVAGHVRITLREYGAAAVRLRKTLELDPEYDTARFLLAE